MAEHHPTVSLPFGRDVDTLVLCVSDEQRRKAIKALALRARYELIHSPMIGNRFKKIIVLTGTSHHQAMSETELAAMNQIIVEVLPTKLEAGCLREIYVL